MMRLIDFSTVTFSPDPGIAGFEMAELTGAANVTVKFWRVPEGWNLGQLGIEENLHAHRTVYEYGAFMDGTFPHIEYDATTQLRDRIAFVPGDLMIRPPGSIHGLHRDMPVPATSLILYWNTGPGTSILDSEYARETADVMDGAVGGEVLLGGQCRIENLFANEGNWPIGEWRTVSLPGEPLQVKLRALKPTEALRSDELVDEQTMFAFLWRGTCLLESPNADDRPVDTWSTLVPTPTDGVRPGDRVRCDTPALWLRVEAR